MRPSAEKKGPTRFHTGRPKLAHRPHRADRQPRPPRASERETRGLSRSLSARQCLLRHMGCELPSRSAVVRKRIPRARCARASGRRARIQSSSLEQEGMAPLVHARSRECIAVLTCQARSDARETQPENGMPDWQLSGSADISEGRFKRSGRSGVDSDSSTLS